MKLRPEALRAHLAKQLLPVYVVAGEEPLLVEESLDAIRAAARKNGFSEREIFDVDRGFDWGRVIASCNSLSLFATRKVIELRMPKGPKPVATRATAESDDDDDDGESASSASGKTSLDGAKVIAEIIERPSPDNLILVTAGKLDYKQQQGGWYMALENAGASVYCAEIPADKWNDWVDARMRASGLKPDADAVQALADRTEGNALAARQDIDKLALLHPDGHLTAETVRAAVADSSRFDAFDLGDRVLGGDAAGAAHTLARLREEGLDVLAILGPLAWMLRQWSQAQAAYARSGNADAACNEARVFPRARIPLFGQALARTRGTQLLGWIRQAAAIDQLAKSTGGKDQAWEELLTLVLAAAGRRVVRPFGL
ncbi:MAG: holA [Panacagrimonas sp.]|jgi:DNA polymerase-3 subunit delta|nr:DNA polymerase III subunit delta [Panacagrimonas sp.]MCC2658165.1 holA [Panacagrimonas sp.]